MPAETSMSWSRIREGAKSCYSILMMNCSNISYTYTQSLDIVRRRTAWLLFKP